MMTNDWQIWCMRTWLKVKVKVLYNHPRVFHHANEKFLQIKITDPPTIANITRGVTSDMWHMSCHFRTWARLRGNTDKRMDVSSAIWHGRGVFIAINWILKSVWPIASLRYLVFIASWLSLPYQKFTDCKETVQRLFSFDSNLWNFQNSKPTNP